MVKSYGRKRSRKSSKAKTRRSKRQRRSTVRSKAWNLAKRACQQVLKKAAQPNYVRTVFGAYDEATGQFDTQIAVASGPDGGYLTSDYPKISIPATSVGKGMPGSRNDNEVSITGVKLSLRIELPQNVSSAKIKAYLFLDTDAKRRMDENDPLYPVMFKAPDEFYMLRDDPA